MPKAGDVDPVFGPPWRWDPKTLEYEYKPKTYLETHKFFPHEVDGDQLKLEAILDEIRLHLLTRADGVKIKLVRTDEFDPEETTGKLLIERVEIRTWDCVA